MKETPDGGKRELEMGKPVRETFELLRLIPRLDARVNEDRGRLVRNLRVKAQLLQGSQVSGGMRDEWHALYDEDGIGATFFGIFEHGTDAQELKESLFDSDTVYIKCKPVPCGLAVIHRRDASY